MAVGTNFGSWSKSNFHPHLMIQTTEFGSHTELDPSELLSSDLAYSGVVDECSHVEGAKAHPRKIRTSKMQDSYSSSQLADKRRNKLGYHRTSVACGHCRKRKIRCLPAADDAQGRCANCIRLKKECNFFPVDQQSQPEGRNRSGSKSDQTPRAGSLSSSSSPAQAYGSSYENPSSFGQVSQSHSSMTPHRPSFSTPYVQTHLNESPSSSSQGSFPPTAYEHPGHIPWESPFLDQSPVANTPHQSLEDPSSSFWRLSQHPGQHPGRPPFASFSGPTSSAGMQQRPNVSSAPYLSPVEDTNWPAGSRSMSYGQVEGLHTQVPNASQYLARHESNLTPVSELYSPPHTTRSASMASMSEPPSAPADGQPLNGLFGSQSMWNPNFIANTMHGVTGKGMEGVGGWYSEPSSGQVPQ